MRIIKKGFIILSIIGVVYIAIKIYIEKTTDPTLSIGADSLRWKGQHYGYGNNEHYELGKFVCRTSDGYKLYEVKGDPDRNEVVVLFPGFMGRYYKYKRE